MLRARALHILSLAAAMSFCPARVVKADVDPRSGVDFVHVGAPGNAPWAGNGFPSDLAIGHGQVNYEYNIGRFEVTTAQWVEFMNAAFDRPAGDHLIIVNTPAVWGAVAATANNAGGLRWTVPAGHEMYPVGGVSWHTAAMYCNWLCNGKSSAASAFQNGAYDVSTFHQVGNGFTDQVTHNASAQYWIPTWDEWLKAAHYDPNRNGPSQGGYWLYSNTSNSAITSGSPGTGQANWGFMSPNPFVIPLGAYPTVQSPWGLLDTAGGTAEWTEFIGTSGGQNELRGFEGSFWGGGFSINDSIYSLSGDYPGSSDYSFGFRIASSVPSLGTGIVLAGVFAISGARRRRRVA